MLLTSTVVFLMLLHIQMLQQQQQKKKKKELRKSLFFSSLYATFQLFNFDAEEASFVGTFDFVCIPLSLSHSSAQEEVLYANFYLSSSRESSSSNSSLRKLHSL